MRNRSFVGVRVPDGTLGFGPPLDDEELLAIDSAMWEAAMVPERPLTYGETMVRRTR